MVIKLSGSIQQMGKIQEISLIGILAAVNIASRIALQALPNIKPVTSIIIISVLLFGLAFGIKLTLVTTLVSNMYLGMGIWTFFQILAWIVICLLTQCMTAFFGELGIAVETLKIQMVVIFVICLFLLMKWKMNPIFVMVLAGLLNVLQYFLIQPLL